MAEKLGLSPEFIKTRIRALIGITFRPKMPWSLRAPSADGSHIVAVAKEAGLGDNHLAFVQTAENLDLGGIQETNSHILAPDKAALAIAQYDLHYRLYLVGPARREGMSPNWGKALPTRRGTAEKRAAKAEQRRGTASPLSKDRPRSHTI